MMNMNTRREVQAGSYLGSMETCADKICWLCGAVNQKAMALGMQTEDKILISCMLPLWTFG